MSEPYKHNGKWVLNGKQVPDLNYDEVNTVSDYFREKKAEEELTHYTNRTAYNQRASIRMYNELKA